MDRSDPRVWFLGRSRLRTKHQRLAPVGHKTRCSGGKRTDSCAEDKKRRTNLRPDLVSALASLQMHDFPHFSSVEVDETYE